MRSRINRKWSTLLAAGAMVGVAACDSPLDPDPHDPGALNVELFDRASGERLAYTHGDHWDGAIPPLQVGQEIAVNAFFIEEDGDTITLGGEYTVEAFLHTDAPEGIVEIANHDDHVDLTGLAEGQTQLIVALWHGGHSDWESPPLTIVVGEHDDAEPAGVRLFERGTENLLTETHGTGEEIEWEDPFPTLAPGEDIEVDVVFVNAAGEPITLGGDLRVEARFVEDAPENVVALENHTDHVDIEALAAGETEVIFAFWHDDHEEWAPPAIALVVEEP